MNLSDVTDSVLHHHLLAITEEESGAYERSMSAMPETAFAALTEAYAHCRTARRIDALLNYRKGWVDATKEATERTTTVEQTARLRELHTEVADYARRAARTPVAVYLTHGGDPAVAYEGDTFEAITEPTGEKVRGELGWQNSHGDIQVTISGSPVSGNTARGGTWVVASTDSLVFIASGEGA